MPPEEKPQDAGESALKAEEKFASLASRSGVSVVLQFTEVGFQFLILFVLTRGLGAEIFGDYIYAITLITFLVMFGRLGFDISSVRFVSGYMVDGHHSLLQGYLKFANRTVFLLAAATGVIFVAVTLLMARSLSRDFLLCLLVASPLVYLMAIVQVQGGILRGLDMSLRSRIPQTVILPVLLLAGAGAVLWLEPAGQKTAWPIAVMQVLATAVAAVVSERWIRVSLTPQTRAAAPEFDRRSWLVSGGVLVLLAAMSKLQAQIDILMLGPMRSTAEAGIYTAASRVAGVPVLVLVASNMVVSPAAARLLKKNDRAAVVRLVRRSGIIVVAFALPLTIGLAVFGEWALGILGAEFKAGYVPLLILLVGQFFFILSGPAGVLLNMSGNEAIMAKVLAGAVVLNVILNAPLIALYGSNGAAIATGISTIACRAALAAAVSRKLGLPSSLFERRIWARDPDIY